VHLHLPLVSRLLIATATIVGLDIALTLAQDGATGPVLVRFIAMLVALPFVAVAISRIRPIGPTATSTPVSGTDAHAAEADELDGGHATLVIAADGTICRSNLATGATLGYLAADVQGRSIGDLVAPPDAAIILGMLADPESGTRMPLQIRIRHLDGRWLTVEAAVIGGRDAAGGPELTLRMHDVTKWKALEEQLTRQAFHDPLTGLPNRALYVDRLEHALGRRRRHAKGVAVMFLDLDDFKTVNDSLGHSEGDTLIRLAAGRLAETIRPDDTAARLGGDEFALLLEDVDEDQAKAVARRVLEALDRPYQLTDRSLRVGVSVGIALSSAGLVTATDMLRAADIAMYNAKDAGKGQFRVFRDSMQQETTDRLRLGVDLRAAIERGEFVIHYQPIVDLPSGEVTGMEALVRWAHPDRGLIPPAEFIPLAESTGLIIPLGEWVLREACVQGRAWQLARPDRPLTINVNLSGVQLGRPGLVAAVSLALEDSEFPPELLTLEITETVMADETEQMIRRMRQLKGIGVGLAIDDFGKGYSSLSYLRRFPVDIVKIDKSFVDGIATGSDELALARAIVRLAHSLKMKTAAEGVELAGQVKRLNSMGCDQAQGYYFAKPMDVRHATAYLLGHTTLSMWVGHQGHELEVIKSVVADFEQLNPELKVDVTGGVFDDRIIAALRSGHVPNVVSSFKHDNFGTYSSGNGLVDLTPYLKRDKIDEGLLTDATQSYTRFNGRQWALPMLADVYGIYFNRQMLADAGLSGPPRTTSELTDYAKKLTKRNPDGSLAVVGFDPTFDFYENAIACFAHAFGARWVDGMGRAAFSSDPAWLRLLAWQEELIDWYGKDDLAAFEKTAGDEFSAANAFECGKLAICLDGDWRVAFIAANVPDLEYGTAPMPVDDARPELYGSGYVNGTILGIPANALQKQESWRLVKYLATDDSALAKLSNGLRNVPSTKRALRSPDLIADEHFAVFLDIFEHPRSSTTPIVVVGPVYQRLLEEFVAAWREGLVTDMRSRLFDLDQAFDAALAEDLRAAEHIEHGRRPPATRTRSASGAPVGISA
jgi:diguanylate cyclase (GGDEF)-like protein/PAS domain S-box-containing protein